MKCYEQRAKESGSIYLNTIWLKKMALLAKLERIYLVDALMSYVGPP